MWLWGRHEIDDWRDQWTLTAAGTLNEVAAGLGEFADREASVAPYREVFVAPGIFIANRIAPRLRAVTEPVVDDLVAHANAALRELVDHQAVWHRRPDETPAASGAWEGMGDIALAAAPLAGGAAVAAALPFVAVSTTTAWLGLVTVTSISWPAILVGGAVAGTAMAAGLHNSGKLRDRFEGRLRGKARAYVAAALLKGTPRQPSVLDQLTACFAEAASRAKGS